MPKISAHGANVFQAHHIGFVDAQKFFSRQDALNFAEAHSGVEHRIQGADVEVIGLRAGFADPQNIAGLYELPLVAGFDEKWMHGEWCFVWSRQFDGS